MFTEKGFDGFVSKPIDIRQMNVVLNKMIRNKQSPEVLEAARQGKLQKPIPEKSEQDGELLALFARDAQRNLPFFKEILENIATATEKDLHLLTIKAHAMKSALANIGESEASGLAASLEKSGNDRDKTVIQEDARVFIESLESVVAKIEANAIVEPDADEDSAYLREQLRIISDACADYDVQAADAALENLQKMSWTKETKALIDQISEDLLRGEFAVAAKRAER